MGLKETDADCSDRHTHGELSESLGAAVKPDWTWEKRIRCWHGTHFRYKHTESLKAKGEKIKHPDTTDKETGVWLHLYGMKETYFRRNKEPFRSLKG